MGKYIIQIKEGYKIKKIQKAVYSEIDKEVGPDEIVSRNNYEKDIISTNVLNMRPPNRVLIVKSNNLKKQIDIMSVCLSEEKIKDTLKKSKIEGIIC